MKLYEYEAKQGFVKFGIPIPNGALLINANQTQQATAHIKPPYAIKAQVLAGGRGKAGGILFANTPQETEQAITALLKTKIKNLQVNKVLVEEKISFLKKLYVGITIDRLTRSYVVLVSATGGVDIEELAAKNPQAITKNPIDQLQGLRSFQAIEIAQKLGYRGNKLVELARIIHKLYQACVANDAELIEVNPLAETEVGFVALDARLTIDDNALFRHPEYKEKVAEGGRELSSQEVLALKNDLAYVKLDGDIGIIGNGAGLVMATLDLINIYGGKPANFLDLGGGATIEKINAALQIVFSDSDTNVLFVNILGGITHCDDVAKAIVEASKTAGAKKPLIVRLIGTNEAEGKSILSNAGISALDSMEQAAKQAVETSKKVTAHGNNN